MPCGCQLWLLASIIYQMDPVPQFVHTLMHAQGKVQRLGPHTFMFIPFATHRPLADHESTTNSRSCLDHSQMNIPPFTFPLFCSSTFTERPTVHTAVCILLTGLRMLQVADVLIDDVTKTLCAKRFAARMNQQPGSDEHHQVSTSAIPANSYFCIIQSNQYFQIIPLFAIAFARALHCFLTVC